MVINCKHENARLGETRKDDSKKKFRSSASLSVGLEIPPNAEPIKPVSQCPYCRVHTTFHPSAWTLNHWIAQCDVCGREFYAQVKYTGAVYGVSGGKNGMRFEVLETYPKILEERYEAIPDQIWDDFFEAVTDYNNGSFKSTVVMCRRTMQNICLDNGATKTDAAGRWTSLRNQIKQAFPGAEYAYLKALSEEIKYFGDYGAHPQDDILDEVTPEEAKDVLAFTRSFIEVSIIQPDRVKKRFEERTK